VRELYHPANAKPPSSGPTNIMAPKSSTAGIKQEKSSPHSSYQTIWPQFHKVPLHR
jgi:hypothetical protein